MAQDTGGLPELLDALRWRWRLVLLFAVPVVVGATVWAERLPSQYDGVAIVAVSPRTGVSPDAVRVLAPKYVEYAIAPATLQRLAPRIDESSADLVDAVDASVKTDTGNIIISVRLPSPGRAVRAADALARDVLLFGQDDEQLRVEIIAPPTRPSGPAAPARRLIEGAALVVGLLLGVAVAFLVERSRPRARTWRDIAVLTGYPVLGRLPSSRALKAPGGGIGDPIVGASVRTLRTNVEREMGGSPGGVILVTSSLSGEGKTTVAGLFATALSRVDMRVLLVDGDLRRPGLAKGFEAQNGNGLARLLRGEGSLMGSIRPGWTPNLTILPTTPDPDAGDLLARRFAEVMMEARARYDAVIVDCPPLLGTDDARTLATQSDGVILVVSAGTMAQPVSEAVLALHTLRVRVLGVCANRVRETSGVGSYAYVGVS